MDLLVRTYPRAVAGTPTSFEYAPDTRVFFVEFEDRDGVSGPTELYIPAARHYPEGWELSVSAPDGSWSQAWDAEREVLSVTIDAEGPHRIEVRPTGS